MYEDLKIQDPNVTVTVSPSVYLKKEPMDLFPFSGKSNQLQFLQRKRLLFYLWEW